MIGTSILPCFDLPSFTSELSLLANLNDRTVLDFNAR
jgi:hypothetical protein